MERYHCHPSFLQFISLTLVLQVTLVSAFPFRPGQPHNRLRPPPLFRSVSGIEYTTVPTTASEDDGWLSTVPVYQIGDGQIQAPYMVSTEEPASGSETVASLASRNEYTAPSSTSTTTVYVVGRGSTTPEPAAGLPTQTSVQPASGDGAQPFVTTVPDQSLTSLTTSEVQTVERPPPTDTSGVSIE